MFVHVTLVPYIECSKELKTKPTQNSVRDLQSRGIQANVLVCRTEYPLPKESKDKISLYCNVRSKDVINNLTAKSLYDIPVMLEKEGLAKSICYHLNLEDKTCDLKDWNEIVKREKNSKGSVKIGIVGEYIDHGDAYLSVSESLRHAAIANEVKMDIKYINPETLTNENIDNLLKLDGIVMPGEFGGKGIDGHLIAVKYARENNIPFLGICLGMQAAGIEFSRNVLNLKDANSTEFDSTTKNPIFNYGSKERLGKFLVTVVKDSKVGQAYNETNISERQRNKFEFSTEYKDAFNKNGLKIVGVSKDKQLVEIIELESHKWFVGVQFHPEFKSRPNRSHPLFREFVKASFNKKP